jgi:hypothetical protein
MLTGFELCLEQPVNTTPFFKDVECNCIQMFSVKILAELHSIVTGNLILSSVFRSEF